MYFKAWKVLLCKGKITIKVREGRRAVDFTKSCVFPYYIAISEHI